MDNKQLIKEATELAEQSGQSKEIILKLVERVEELTAEKEPQSIVWEPKEGEEYFYVAGNGKVCRCAWRPRADSIDRKRLKHHNVYKTRELAEKAAPYQARYNMVLQAVMNLEPNQKVDWNDKEQSKYQPYFDYQAGVWRSWGKHYTQPLENGYRPLTDEKNVQPLLDYLNRKEQENG
jgi:uncharacterized coiled-coil DUF342 family protein